MIDVEVASPRASIEALHEGHLPSLVAAHEACFPGHFLTNLGSPFLRAYYGNYIRSRYGIGAVAVDERGDVVAFATGTSDLSSQDSDLLKRRFALILWAALRGSVTSPEFRRQVRERAPRIGGIVRRVARRSRAVAAPPAGTETRRLPAVTLTSVGVVPTLRGSGLSTKTVAAFEEQAHDLGFRRVRASTSLDNDRAVAFYRKIGWTVERVLPELNRIDFEHLVEP